MRALSLAILNAEIGLVEPWAAAGNYVTTADSNDPRVKGVVLQYEASRLLVVTRVAQHAQYVPQHANGGSVSFVLPGVPESHEVAELSGGGLRPLKCKRVTGGTLITIEDFDLSALVLITPDAVMTGALARRLAGFASRAAALEKELATASLAEVEEVERRLPSDVRDASATATLLAAARRSFEEANKAFAAGDRRAAYVAARRVHHPLGQLRRSAWDRAFESLQSSTASPYLASFTTLPDHWRLLETLRAATVGSNQLAGGDFENLSATVDAGWHHVVHPLAGIETTVDISPGGTANGRACLRMEVRAKEAAGDDALVETTPVWITSPQVAVRQGEIIRIKGRVRVATPVRGSVDGLMIVDSLGGEGLAERFGQTGGWEDFVLYRAAPQDGQVTVTFALTGFGEAMLDDITICPMRVTRGSLPLAIGRPDNSRDESQMNSHATRRKMDSSISQRGTAVKEARRVQPLFAPPRR
jgi:hypothetical protein